MSIEVRPARSADLAVIVDYNMRLASETETKTLDHETLARGVAAVLEEPARGRYFVAERDGAVVGQLLITYEWSDWRNGTFWWLQSVYVAAAERRRGVFSALYSEVLDAARRDGGVCGLRLYVEQANRNAERTYRARGFDSTPYRVMEIELERPSPRS